jgi:hypothetical protein
MSSSELVQRGGLAAMLAGVAFVVAVALVGANSEPPAGSFYDDLIGVVLVVALLLLAAGLAGLHALQKGSYGRLGAAGFYAAFVAAFVEVAAFVARLSGTPLELLELLGILGLVVGLVLYGAATLRAGVLPRWCGAGLIAGLPAWVVLALVFEVAGAVLGAVLFGLVWVALGYALRSRREATGQQRSARVV